MKLSVEVEILDHAKGLPLPEYMTEGASGVDLYAAINEPLSLMPGKTALIPTGLRMAIPPGYEAQIRPRSGLALKHGISILNTPGTIDSDYRGEIKIIVINFGDNEYIVNRGERIAQMVICPVVKATFEVVNSLSRTERGARGFGHTG